MHVRHVRVRVPHRPMPVGVGMRLVWRIERAMAVVIH
jgi:hypothetical protein